MVRHKKGKVSGRDGRLSSQIRRNQSTIFILLTPPGAPYFGRAHVDSVLTVPSPSPNH